MAIWDRADGHGCDFCGRIKTAISQCERSVKKNGSLKDYPKFFNLIKSTKIKNDIKEILNQIPAGSKSIYFDWYCKKHKHTWNTFVRRIVLDEHGCNYCGYDKMIATKRKKQIFMTNKFMNKFPHLVNEWYPKKDTFINYINNC